MILQSTELHGLGNKAVGFFCLAEKFFINELNFSSRFYSRSKLFDMISSIGVTLRIL